RSVEFFRRNRGPGNCELGQPLHDHEQGLRGRGRRPVRVVALRHRRREQRSDRGQLRTVAVHLGPVLRGRRDGERRNGGQRRIVRRGQGRRQFRVGRRGGELRVEVRTGQADGRPNIRLGERREARLDLGDRVGRQL